MQPAVVLRALRDECGSFFDMLYRLRAVLLFAPVLVIAFANDQIIDVAREYMHSERHFADRFDFVLVTLAVTAAVPILFIPFILDRQDDGEARYGFGRRLAIGVVISVALLPAVYFLADITSGPQGLVTDEFSAWNTSPTSILLLCGIITLVFALLPPVLFAPLKFLWRVLRLSWVYVGFVAVVLVVYLGLCLLPLLVGDDKLFSLVGGFAQRLGVFPFIGLFALALFALAALSTRLFDAWRIPLLSLIVLVVVGFSVTGLNSDFNARLLPGETQMQPKPIGLAFREWLAARKDYQHDQQASPPRPYPVYLVAMAGGGAYAGFHSAYFLARLFESCPRLRHHTFAISGVSGGALGATLIAAEAAGNPDSAASASNADPLACNVDPAPGEGGAASRQIEQFFARDHVSFLIWARLFPDMLRRLFWFNEPQMSSDTLFEEWFTANWAGIAGKHGALSLANSVYSYWSPQGDAPAVLLNITNTQTGRNEVVSPLHFPRNLPSRMYPDMRLITAASLSFRIPFLNSPGTLPRTTSFPAQGFDPVTNYDTLETTATYVDGSYYETSGLSVLDRVRAEIKKLPADLNVEVRVISFTLAPNRETLRSSDRAQDTMLAPVNALFAARVQRGVDEWEAFLRQHGDFDAYLSLYQDNFNHHLPLGWTLSQQSLSFIKHHYGVPSDCSYAERFWERMLDDFDGARAFLDQRFPQDEYGVEPPYIRPRDLDVRDSNRLSKLNMLSERIYMGCQVGKIFRDLAN